MKKKTAKVTEFIEGLHKYIVTHPQFRKDTSGKSETQIQTEIRPLIVNYLERYFDKSGVQDAVRKAHSAFYWEGQEGKYGKERSATFGARNYPDFIIDEPYVIAIEYKQSCNGSTVKQGIGQSMMHTLTEDFDFVYYLFHDQSADKKIEKSLKNEKEKQIIAEMWSKYNVFIRFV
ncbi:MAG: hypothetical protein JW725_03460 [Candidatus Babeliaceae bacterium]|nr:hypothetical protein [Candidatus Babeliaceae bacterium]